MGQGGGGRVGEGVGRGGKDKSLNTNLQIQSQTLRWRDMNFVCTRRYRSINRETRLQSDLLFLHFKIILLNTIAEGNFASFSSFVVLVVLSIICFDKSQ